MKFIKKSLKAQISLPIIVVALAITIITTAIYVSDEYGQSTKLEEKFIGDTQQLAATLAYVVTPYLIQNNYVYMKKLVSVDLRHDHFQYVLITDDRNRILAHSANENIGGVFAAPAAQGTENGGVGSVRRYNKNGKLHIDISEPVKAGDLVIGAVWVGMSTELLEKEKTGTKRTIVAFVLTALAIMILGVVSAILTAGRIAKPILLLKERAERIGQGDYGHELHLSRSDEIGELASSFDRMIVDLRDSRIQLEKRTNELELRRQEAEAANKSKSDFLANMSHELRTPLNAIIGFSELMVRGMVGPLAETQKEYLSDILHSGRHLLSLINDILDLARIEAGKMECEPSEFNLADLVDRSLVLFHEKVLKHGIQLGVDVDREMPPVQGDERKIKQVIFNLFSNAVKFTPDGGSVTIRTRTVNEGGVAYAEVAVADNGIGISSADQKRLFQPFMQVDPQLTKKYEGTGLGLAISKNLVELHQGSLVVESRPGQGSTFTVKIPLRALAQVAEKLGTSDHKGPGARRAKPGE